MKKPIQIVTVHSSFPTFDYIINKEGRLLGQDEGIERGQPIQLYAVCDDEIKEGDIVLNLSSGEVFEAKKAYIGTIESDTQVFKRKWCVKVLLTPEQIGFFKEIKSNGVASMDSTFPITIEQLQSILSNDGKCYVEMEEYIPESISYGLHGNDEPPTDIRIKLINGKAIISITP